MWIANLVILLIILVCAGYQYKKATFVKSFTTIIIAICASVIAFGYFEVLAGIFISRGENSRWPWLVSWAQPLCFLLLFVLAFAILQTIAVRLTRIPIDLGLVAERIGRIVCGIFSGLILSGLLVIVVAMAPVPSKYPYQRFEQTNPDPEKPNKVLLNADGFAAGWFSILSKGSFSGEKSFAALHPAFLDQVFLNRHSIADNISIVTSSAAIEVPKKNGLWLGPEGLTYADTKEPNKPGKPVEAKDGYNLTIVRVGIKKRAIKQAGRFTLSQLRLICKQKRYAERPLAGKGENIYPVGYLKAAKQLQKKRLDEQIKIEPSGFDGKVKWIDFAFYVPEDYVPVLVEFKQNNIAQLSASISVE